jgi:hypothetical protein
MKQAVSLKTNTDENLTCEFHPTTKKTNYFRMKWILIVALLITFAKGYSQQSSPFSIETGFIRPGSEIRQQSSFQLSLPLFISDNNTFVVSPQYRILGIKNGLPIPENGFNQFSLRFVWRHKLTDDWNAAFFASPSLASSVGNFSGNGLMMFSGVRFSKTQSPAFHYYFGLVYSHRFSTNILVPIAGLKWKISPTLSFNGNLPYKWQLNWAIKPNFYTGLSLKGNRFTSYIPDNPDFDYFWFREQNLGMTSEIKIIRNFWLTAETGYSIKRNFNLYTKPENPEWNFGLKLIQPPKKPFFKHAENGFYVKFGLVYRLNRNSQEE